MFDFLKKKVKEFVSSVVGAEEKKPGAQIQAQPVEEAKLSDAAIPAASVAESEQKTQPKDEQPEPEAMPTQPALPVSPEPSSREQEVLPQPAKPPQEEKPELKLEKTPVTPFPAQPIPSQPPIASEHSIPSEPGGNSVPQSAASEPASKEIGEELEEDEIEEIVGETREGQAQRDAEIAARRIVEERDKQAVASKVFSAPSKESFLRVEKQREIAPRLGLFSQLKSAFTGQVEITEKEAGPLFGGFEIALLESDVSLDTATALCNDLKSRLIGKSVAKGRLAEEINKEIAYSLSRVMQGSKRSLFEMVSQAKSCGATPFVIMFIGPNGAGKTTTVAKVAHLLSRRGFSSVISASDTFRAAAIEQAVHHGEKLGVRVIRHSYGSDPSAVAFDAIAHAKSGGIDVVLVDTAGRQETNRNLLSEMEKMVRITKPSLKLFVAEAIAGASLVPQVKAFHEKLQLDGLVLTKLDCDAKGGGSISIAYECKLPIFFVGVGQGYDDLKEFNEEWIIRNVLAE
ncbi:MAG: signal recognition particle-docking protein FtsY [Candidatus Micrarchaeota archaeon]